MTMKFDDLLSKLDSHFNETPDDDIIFVSATDGAPHSHYTTSPVKTEKIMEIVTTGTETTLPVVTKATLPLTYEELLEESDEDDEPVQVSFIFSFSFYFYN